jgi:hypothetical protein
MPTLIKPGSVKVVTKEGEIQVSLTLDLNINLNTEGLVLESKVSSVEAQSNPSYKNKSEKVEWAIPDFDTSQKIDFGK